VTHKCKQGCGGGVNVNISIEFRMDIEDDDSSRSLLPKRDNSLYHRQGELNASKWRIAVSVYCIFLLMLVYQPSAWRWELTDDNNCRY